MSFRGRPESASRSLLSVLPQIRSFYEQRLETSPPATDGASSPHKGDDWAGSLSGSRRSFRLRRPLPQLRLKLHDF